MAIIINTAYHERLTSDMLNKKIENFTGKNAKLSGFDVSIINNTSITITKGKAHIAGCAIEETTDSRTLQLTGDLLSTDGIVYAVIEYIHNPSSVNFKLVNTLTDNMLVLGTLFVKSGTVTEVTNHSIIKTMDDMIGIAADNEAETIRNSIHSGFATLSEIDYDFMATAPNKIKLKTESVAYINGYKITVPAGTITDIDIPPEKDPREDLVFLESWKDIDFGKTGRLKWRLRSVAGVDFNTYKSNGFVKNDVSLNGEDINKQVLVQGGNAIPLNWVHHNYSGFVQANTKTVNMYQKNIDINDAGLYISGYGKDSKNHLKTLDGYVYAIPIFRVYRRPSCGYMTTNEYNVISPLCNPLDTRKITSKEKVASSLDSLKVTVERKSLRNLIDSYGDEFLWKSDGVADNYRTLKILNNYEIKMSSNGYNHTFAGKKFSRPISMRSNRKYFVSMKTKVSSITPMVTLNLNLGKTKNLLYLSTNGSEAALNYKQLSKIYTPDSDIDEAFLRIELDSSTDVNFSSAYFKDLIVYDLTEIYGMGKEPTDIEKLERELLYVDGLQTSKPIAIKSIGKNLFDKSKLEQHKTILDNGNITYSTLSTNYIMPSIKLKPSTNYKFNTTKVGIEPNQYNGTMVFMYSKGILTRKYWMSASQLLTTSSNEDELKIRYTATSGVAETSLSSILTTQLEEGTITTTYEDYKESQVILPSDLLDITKALPNGAKDTIALINNRFTQRVGEIIFNGSEAGWGGSGMVPQLDTLIFQINYSGNSTVNIKTAARTSSDKFPVIDFNQDIEGITSNAGGTNGQGIYIRILKSRLLTPDPAGFREWLKSNPIKVYYELATPIEHDISDLVKGRLYVNPENTTFQIDQVSQKMVTPVSVPNLVTNGDFSDGATRWAGTGNNSGVVSIINNKILFNGTSSASGGYYQDINIPTGNKIAIIFQPRNESNTTCPNVFIHDFGTFVSGTNILPMSQYNSKFVNIFSSKTNGIRLYFQHLAGVTYTNASFSDIFVIDLTAMFGADNEPSKEWCDKYLEFGTNYKLEVPSGNKVLAIERDNKDVFKGVQGNIGVIPSSKYRDGIYNVYYKEPSETHVSPDVTIEIGTKKLEIKDNIEVGSLDLSNEIGYKKHSDGAKIQYLFKLAPTITQPGDIKTTVVDRTVYDNITIGDICRPGNIYTVNTYSIKILDKLSDNTIMYEHIGTSAHGANAGVIVAIPKNNYFMLYSDIVNKDDITNLRHKVSLTGFDYQGLIEQSFNSLLQGENLN